jgi:putative hemolysin
MHDVLEALTGEFASNDATQAGAAASQNGEWLLNGAMPMHDAKDRLALKHLPDLDRARYHTLGGMIMSLLGRVPVAGDQASWEGWRFEVVAMNRKRIGTVRARRLVADAFGDNAARAA